MMFTLGKGEVNLVYPSYDIAPAALISIHAVSECMTICTDDERRRKVLHPLLADKSYKERVYIPPKYQKMLDKPRKQLQPFSVTADKAW